MEKVSVAPIPKPASQPVNIESNQRAEEREHAAVVESVHGYGDSYSDGRGFDLTEVPVVERKESPQVEKAGEGGLIVDDGIKELRDGQMGAGELLGGDVRQRMETAFGVSFSHVRAHTDVKAAELSRRVNARAFTVGNHIAFGHGEYRPGTMAGDVLIAHELAHTIQQNGGNGVGDKTGLGGAEHSRLEEDADRTALGVAGRLWGGFKGMVRQSLPVLRSGLKLQRCGASQNRTAAMAPAVPAAPDPCPTSVVLESTQDLTPRALDMGYRTGYGILAVMHLLPDSGDWSGAQVFERVSLASTTCPSVWSTNMCTAETRPFPISQSQHSAVLGDLPAQRNRFYDTHRTRWDRGSMLHDSARNPTGMDECTVVCNQSYVCGERVLGNFRITRNFHKSIHNGREITEVNVTKTAVP